MVQRIMTFIKDHPSYFKKSKTYLAARFNCSEKTIATVLANLQEEKREYYITGKSK